VQGERKRRGRFAIQSRAPFQELLVKACQRGRLERGGEQRRYEDTGTGRHGIGKAHICVLLSIRRSVDGVRTVRVRG
jgi:hypothetical protein